MNNWNGDIKQSLKWMQANATKMQRLIDLKAQWYQRNHDRFWTLWATTIFDLRTANAFGLMLWCIILGLPPQLFGLQSTANSWAFGVFRKNFKWNPTDNPGLANPELVGGNFYGSGNTTLTSFDEVRWCLMLRYANLTGNGRVENVNRMLKAIFSPNVAWDLTTTGGRFFIVDDNTRAGSAMGVMRVQYIIGKGMGFSPQFVNLLRDTRYEILPGFAGNLVTVTQLT